MEMGPQLKVSCHRLEKLYGDQTCGPGLQGEQFILNTMGASNTMSTCLSKLSLINLTNYYKQLHR